MSQDIVTGALASGGQFRVQVHLLEIFSPGGNLIASFNTNTFSGVRRDGQIIVINRFQDSDITINVATVDEASQLERSVQTTLSSRAAPQPPPPSAPAPPAQPPGPSQRPPVGVFTPEEQATPTGTPPPLQPPPPGYVPPQPAPPPPIQPERPGSSTGKYLIFGGLGCFVLIVLACIAIIAAVVIFSDDSSDSTSVVLEATATPSDGSTDSGSGTPTARPDAPGEGQTETVGDSRFLFSAPASAKTASFSLTLETSILLLTSK